MDKDNTAFATHSGKRQRASDLDYFEGLGDLFDSSSGSSLDKLRAFSKFVPLPDLARFMARLEIFKLIENVHGSIVECGVHTGAGIMSWAAFSAILEPINHIRKVYGFDTFDGFPEVVPEDQSLDSEGNEHLKRGGLLSPGPAEIRASVELYDKFRPIGHVDKVQLIQGDAVETIPRFLEEHPHLIVSLLYLDFDIYKPTVAAIQALLPRMPKGAVIAFDELGHPDWPGETLAANDTLGISNLKLRRFTYQPQISYAVIE